MKTHHILTLIAFVALCAGAALGNDHLILLATFYYTGLMLAIAVLAAIYIFHFRTLDYDSQCLSAERFLHEINPKTHHWIMGVSTILIFTYAGQFVLPLAMTTLHAAIVVGRQHMQRILKTPVNL